MRAIKWMVVMALSCIVGVMNAQSLQRLYKKALQAYEAKDLKKALAYTEVILKQEENLELLFKAGLTSLELRDYRAAISYLNRIPLDKRKDDLAYTDYFLGLAYKGVGEYDRAITQLERFNMSCPEAGDELDVAKELADCFWAIERLYFPVKIKIKNIGLTVNTVHDEISPLLYADKLYFSIQSDSTARLYSKIKGCLSQLAKENSEITEGEIKNIAFTADAQRMFFNICDRKTGKCELYSRTKTFEGEWGSPKKLPRIINMPEYTAMQPAFGYDRTLKRYVLYFVSDRPNGKGGLDIWASVMERDESFNEPFPLPFNTEKDEITPYFHQASQTLFFSSNGMTGFGGFDVFKSKKISSQQWSDPLNLGNPLNSSFDECYFSFHTASKKALFSSNRPGGVNDGTKIGLPSFDIYEAQIFVELKPRLFDAIYNYEITKATVLMEETITGKLNTYQLHSSSDEMTIPLDLERIYDITFLVEDHLPVTIQLNTLGINFTKLFEPEVKVQPVETALRLDLFKGIIKP